MASPGPAPDSITAAASRSIAALTVRGRSTSRYRGQRSTVPPARSMRVGARASMRRDMALILPLPSPRRSGGRAVLPSGAREARVGDVDEDMSTPRPSSVPLVVLGALLFLVPLAHAGGL